MLARHSLTPNKKYGISIHHTGRLDILVPGKAQREKHSGCAAHSFSVSSPPPLVKATPLQPATLEQAERKERERYMSKSELARCERLDAFSFYACICGSVKVT
jgi:hypothetical protein